MQIQNLRQTRRHRAFGRWCMSSGFAQAGETDSERSDPF